MALQAARKVAGEWRKGVAHALTLFLDGDLRLGHHPVEERIAPVRRRGEGDLVASCGQSSYSGTILGRSTKTHTVNWRLGSCVVILGARSSCFCSLRN